jgi:predicted Na+-dependent transporter
VILLQGYAAVGLFSPQPSCAQCTLGFRLTIFCVVPTTLGVGVALTAASRGNQALALLLTISTNLLGIITVTVWMLLASLHYGLGHCGRVI